MWTGTGYATVNPKYVDQYLAKGYTLDLPSDEQVKEFIKNPIETGQVRDPLTGAVSDAPTLATPPATQDTRNIIGYRDGSPILQVTPEGVAPANAQIGDIIRTAGGDYLITGGTVGNWERMKLDGVTQDVTEDAQAPGVAQEGFVDDFGQFQFQAMKLQMILFPTWQTHNIRWRSMRFNPPMTNLLQRLKDKRNKSPQTSPKVDVQ